MLDILSKILLPLTFILFCVYALYDVVSHPGSLNGWGYLAGAIFLEILVVVLWDYRGRFFPLLVVVFLLAGTDSPLNGPATSARWLVLALGALAGVVIYLRDRDHFFGTFHLVALFCVVAALVSAMVSAFPRVALLKAASLLLVFLYGAFGARTAVIGREAKFFFGLLRCCELMVYFSAVCYFVLRYAVFGNPNSLGVVMGIVTMPILLWGVLISEGTSVNRRWTFALVLCILLLLTSHARAAILGASVSALLLCVALRRYRLLLKGVGLVLAGAVVVAALTPVKPGPSESLASSFLYKGHEDKGVMGSRRTPWEKTSAVIEQRPWFGAGFGTSVTTATTAELPDIGTFSTTTASSREHGNSYLAILEWVGLLGVVPFAALVFMIAVHLGRVVIWIRRTGSPFSPAVPIAAVLVAGLIHAIFEDWLFAVGYYMCIFFWTLAFVLVDVIHGMELQPRLSMSAYPSHTWERSHGMVRPAR
jgi:O-antigen ligase